jgi:hypothetical protein
MAGIDKIYATKQGAESILEFLGKNRKFIKAKTHLDPMNFTYSSLEDLNDWSNWDENEPDYDPTETHPITNFPESIDVCLWQMDNLPDALKKGLEKQYSKNTLEMFKRAEGKYSFRRWNPSVATRFRFDWTEYKFPDRHHRKRLPLARGFINIQDGYYYGPDNPYEWGISLWFTDGLRDGRGWTCDTLDLNDNCYGTCSGAFVRVRSMKAFLRWLRKAKFPKGTVLSCDYGWEGSDFKVYCS